jgi:YbbR domain-containing protein
MRETASAAQRRAATEKNGRGASPPDPVLKELTGAGSGPVVEDAADVDAAQHWRLAAEEAASLRGLVTALPVPVARTRRALPALLRGVRWERLTRLGLAFLMAVVLWLYVLGLENPSRPAVYPNLPLKTEGLASDLFVVNDPGEARLVIQAPQDVLAHTYSGDFTPYVDLTGLQPGTHDLDVQVHHPADVTQIQVEPSHVTVQLGLRGSRTSTVEVKPLGRPDLSYQIDAMQADPTQVTISGPKEQVDRVQSVVAEIAIEGTQNNQAGQVKPRALDAAGREVPDLTFDPPYVRATVVVKLLVNLKTLPVHAPLDGDPAPGFRVTDISVQPTTLIVQAQPAVLQDLNVLDTAPVSIAGITRTLNTSVTVSLPPGVTLSPNQISKVSVQVAVEEMTTRMTLSARVRTQGLGPGLEAVTSPDRIEVRVTGSFEALQAIDPNSLQAVIDLNTLGPGTYDFTPLVPPPNSSTKVVERTPSTVSVTITALATMTPVPSPSAPPSSSPSPLATIGTPSPVPPPPALPPGLISAPTPAATHTPAPTAAPVPTSSSSPPPAPSPSAAPSPSPAGGYP